MSEEKPKVVCGYSHRGNPDNLEYIAKSLLDLVHEMRAGRVCELRGAVVFTPKQLEGSLSGGILQADMTWALDLEK